MVTIFRSLSNKHFSYSSTESTLSFKDFLTPFAVIFSFTTPVGDSSVKSYNFGQSPTNLSSIDPSSSSLNFPTTFMFVAEYRGWSLANLKSRNSLPFHPSLHRYRPRQEYYKPDCRYLKWGQSEYMSFLLILYNLLATYLIIKSPHNLFTTYSTHTHTC